MVCWPCCSGQELGVEGVTCLMVSRKQRGRYAGVLPPELVLGERGPCCVGYAAKIPRYPLQSLRNIFSEMLIWGYN